MGVGVGVRQGVSAEKGGSGSPWEPPWCPRPPPPPGAPLSPGLEINRFVSQRPGDTEDHRQEWEAGRPPLSKCPEEGGWGVGTGYILTSTHSGQRAFKVLSERLIETSEGRKTKAHTPPPRPQPPTATLTSTWGLGP